MLTKQRTALWDNLRFLLILTVVIGHFADSITASSPISKSLMLFIYSFHMPLFIYISGLFHKNSRISEKIVSYLAIYVVFKIALFAVRRCTGIDTTFQLLVTDDIPWFMFALAVYVALGYLLRNVNLKFVLVIWVLTACFVGYDETIGDLLVLSRIIIFFPFYLLGMLTDREKLERFLKKPSLKVLGAVVLAVWGLVCLLDLNDVYILRHLFTARNPFREDLGGWGCLYRLGCYVLSGVTGLACMLITPSRELGPITRFGQRTLQVYFWHNLIRTVILQAGLHELCLTLGRPGVILWSLVLPTALTLLLCLKPFRFPTDQLLQLSAKPKE